MYKMLLISHVHEQGINKLKGRAADHRPLMDTAATPALPPEGKEGMHFVIPEGTAIIRLTADSWSEWGVDKAKVTSVTIPSSVTRIGDRAFSRCRSLTSLAIPSSVTSIGDYAFSGCSSLTSLEIPTSVTSIGGYAFSGCSSLASLAIPSSVTSIDDCAFAGCSSLASLAIPSSVVSIGDCAFDKCSSLASFTIPSSVTNIGVQTFKGCSSLASLTLPSTMASIKVGTFDECTSVVTLLVQPVEMNAIVNTGDANCWSRLFASFVEDADSDADSDASMDDDDSDASSKEEYDQLLPAGTKIWAPDTVVSQLTGPFEACAKLADVPRHLRAAPDAKTWAGVQLWLWWLPPSAFRDSNGEVLDDRVMCKSRAVTIWITMMVGLRGVKLAILPYLPPELWLRMFNFLKHDQLPKHLVPARQTEAAERAPPGCFRY